MAYGGALVRWIVFACALFAMPPAYARDSYDCADSANLTSGFWVPDGTQARQFYSHWEQAFPNHADFMVRSCGIVENGKKMILVGALHIDGDEAVCDDDANFGVLFNPRTLEFGDVAPHQKLCGHGMRIKRPPQ